MIAHYRLVQRLQKSSPSALGIQAMKGRSRELFHFTGLRTLVPLLPLVASLLDLGLDVRTACEGWVDMDTVAVPQIVDVQWQLVEIETPAARIQITATDGDATIRFTREPHAEIENARRFSGNTGGNAFEGAYRINGDRSLSVVSLSPTELYCGDRAFEIEQVYLAALSTMTSYEVQIDQLRLYSADQQSIITFRKGAQ